MLPRARAVLRIAAGNPLEPVLRLRTADALQLAAAFIGAERRPSSLELVTLDDRLASAARKEGFVLTDL